MSANKIIRAFLLLLGWLVAAFALWVLLVGLELYWNLYTWQPKLDSRALGLGLGVGLAVGIVRHLFGAPGYSCLRVSARTVDLGIVCARAV